MTATDLAGSTFVVTGGNTGLGYFAAGQLAHHGAAVVLACRNPAKAAAAVVSLSLVAPGVEISTVTVDLGDLSSVAAAVTTLSSLGPIDGLIANAGLTDADEKDRTVDGHELMFGVNHLGHFALIAGVLPLLSAAAARPGRPEAPRRVVHLGSISHEFFELDLDHLGNEAKFRSFRAYGRSKLAVMTFGFELDRRLRESGSVIRSVVAHPGLALDALTPDRPGVTPTNRSNALTRSLFRVAAQGKDRGAESIVHAAVAPPLQGGEYVGPSGWRQLRGAPRVVPAKPYARDRTIAGRLWTRSEELTGVALGAATWSAR